MRLLIFLLLLSIIGTQGSNASPGVRKPVVISWKVAEPGFAFGFLESTSRDILRSDSSRLRQLFPNHHDDELSRIYTLLIPPGYNPDSALARLRRNKLTEYAELNHVYHIDAAAPNDSLYGEQWYLRNMRVPEAWKITTGDTSIHIGFIDTGVDWLHPDLAHQFAVNAAEDRNHNGLFDAWPSTVKQRDFRGNLVEGDLDGIDNDGNGFVDDVIGYNFVDQESLNFGDYQTRDALPVDENGHGTLVAGVIAAEQNNRIGISGVAPGVRLVALRAFDATGNAEDDDVASAIVYAVDNGVRIVNLSFGDIVSSRLQRDAVRYAESKNVLMVASSGNSGGFEGHYPSDFGEVLSVGATSNYPQEDIVASTSTSGVGLDLVAPGVSILSTSAGGGYRSVNGTSFSAPATAAVAGLLLSSRPHLSSEELRSILISSARDIAEPGFDSRAANGTVDAGAALRFVGTARIHLYSPETFASYRIGTTIPIIADVQSTLFSRWEVRYDSGNVRPKLQPHTLIASGNEQRIGDTLARWETSGLAAGQYHLALAVVGTDGRSTEEHILIQLVEGPPVIREFSPRKIWVNNERGLFATVTSDVPTKATLFYSTGGGSMQSTSDDRFGKLHGILIKPSDIAHGVEIRLRIVVESTTGDTASKDAVVIIPKEAVTDRGFSRKPYALPAGFLLDTVVASPEGLLAVENVFNSGASFGMLKVFRFAQGKFTLHDSLSDPWIPRDIGSARSATTTELLLQSGGRTQVWSSTPSRPLLGALIYDSPESKGILGSRFADLDGDGIDELVVQRRLMDTLYTEVFEVLKWNGVNFDSIGVMRNTSEPATNQAQNRFVEPNTGVGDLSKSGKDNIVAIDNDADVLVYAKEDYDYPVKYLRTNEGEAEGSLVTVADVDADGLPEIIYATHSSFLPTLQNEYEPGFWHVTVLKNLGGYNFKSIYDDEFYYLRPLSPYRSSIGNAKNVDAFAGEEIALSLFPNFYLLGFNAEQGVHPIWYDGVSLTARAVLTHDFDDNGIPEFGVVEGDSIRFYERDGVPIASPGGLHAVSLDSDVVRIDWGNVAAAESYQVLRSKDTPDNFSLLGETASLSFLDSAVDNLTTYFYSVVAVNSASQSEPAFTVSVFVHPRPRILRVEPVSARILRVVISQPLATPKVGGLFAYDVDSALSPLGRIANTVTIASDSDLLLTFTEPIPSGPHSLRAISDELRDRFGSPLRASDTANWRQPEYPSDEAHFFITLAEFMPASILVYFNRIPSDDALETIKYTFTPPRTIAGISRVVSNPMALRVRFGESKDFKSIGRPYLLCVRDISSIEGIPIEPVGEACIGLSIASTDLEHLIAYPQPVKYSDESLRFAGLTYETELRIFSQDSRLLRVLKAKSGEGAIDWDLRDDHGALVPSGVYLYRASGKTADGNEVSSGLAKFVVVAN